VIFVDTGAWFASVVPSDSDHPAAARWLSQNTETLLTTDYVVDETLTLLKMRGEPQRALQMGEEFFRESLATIYYLTANDIQLAWETFQRFSDKEWSFTDCASKIVIDKLKLTHAFAFDRHFQQFGTAIILP
jgi:predicted nucleic acid-binding protein